MIGSGLLTFIVYLIILATLFRFSPRFATHVLIFPIFIVGYFSIISVFWFDILELIMQVLIDTGPAEVSTTPESEVGMYSKIMFTSGNPIAQSLLQIIIILVACASYAIIRPSNFGGTRYKYSYWIVIRNVLQDFFTLHLPMGFMILLSTTFLALILFKSLSHPAIQGLVFPAMFYPIIAVAVDLADELFAKA